MAHTIKTIYVVHHSHTDIGYTDLQERVIDCQIDNIRTAIKLMQSKDNENFRWNCETYFCVELFLQEATENEKNDFFSLVKEGRIGISASYLNFCDLVDSDILKKRVAEMCDLFRNKKITIETAMIADINGISMGQRDALLENGVKFLYTNIHTHHGMYPLYENQNAYLWENQAGQQLLVWNGEHYNLGNALGLKANRNLHPMSENYFGNRQAEDDDIQTLHNNLENYLKECEENGYPYDFIISSVSGFFSDNAPPNIDIIHTIEAYQRRYGNEVVFRMVTLQELYDAIRGRLGNVPVYQGDLTDWWANGIGSTPYGVKHYREAQHMYKLAGKLDANIYCDNAELTRIAEDNLLLYAEHTWGYSATVTNPYDTMVSNLEIRKQSYASKAHEAAALLQNRAMKNRGASMRYYNTTGELCAINTGERNGQYPVEFYIEVAMATGLQIEDESGRKPLIQLSNHPRGTLISFIDSFEPYEMKKYRYTELPAERKSKDNRHRPSGVDGVMDIENGANGADRERYCFPYQLESDYFRITYEIGKGFTSFWNKKDGYEMLGEGLERFFTPIYERTTLLHKPWEERGLLGRNIRGQHAEVFQGVMTGVNICDSGPVFIEAEFTFLLEGTRYCSIVLKLYRELPRIDYALRMAKELTDEIESVYLPLSLNIPDRTAWLKKGEESFRPGVDQIPGTCMEYWMTDEGVVFQQEKGSVFVYTQDVPLVYMGEMRHHSVRLCDNQMINNHRPVYSWVMNNTWETNFKLDLSGYGEFCYRIELNDSNNPEDSFRIMSNNAISVFSYITK